MSGIRRETEADYCAVEELHRNAFWNVQVPGIRCALLSDPWSAKMTRLHNDTNMMALGAGVVGENLALEIVDTWLGTEFSGEARHQRRIDKVMALEQREEQA